MLAYQDVGVLDIVSHMLGNVHTCAFASHTFFVTYVVKKKKKNFKFGAYRSYLTSVGCKIFLTL